MLLGFPYMFLSVSIYVLKFFLYFPRRSLYFPRSFLFFPRFFLHVPTSSLYFPKFSVYDICGIQNSRQLSATNGRASPQVLRRLGGLDA